MRYAPTTPQSLAQIPIALAHLRDRSRTFDQAVRPLHFEPATQIADAHELSHNLYCIMQGRAQFVARDRPNRRLVLTTLGPGAIFDCAALSGVALPGHLSVQAAGEATIWAVDIETARTLIERQPLLRWALLQTYAARLTQVEQQMETVAYKTLPARVAERLLALSDCQNRVITGVSHRMLADDIGTYRETVSAILIEFKRRRWVAPGRLRIDVLDVEGLMGAAGV